jgi:hypothetical protein
MANYLSQIPTEPTPGSVMAGVLDVEAWKHLPMTDQITTADAIVLSSTPALTAAEGIYALKFANSLNSPTTSGIFYLTVTDKARYVATIEAIQPGNQMNADKSWYIGVNDATITRGVAEALILNPSTSLTAIKTYLGVQAQSLTSAGAINANEAVGIVSISPAFASTQAVYAITFKINGRDGTNSTAYLTVSGGDEQAIGPMPNPPNSGSGNDSGSQNNSGGNNGAGNGGNSTGSGNNHSLDNKPTPDYDPDGNPIYSNSNVDKAKITVKDNQTPLSKGQTGSRRSVLSLILSILSLLISIILTIEAIRRRKANVPRIIAIGAGIIPIILCLLLDGEGVNFTLINTHTLLIIGVVVAHILISVASLVFIKKLSSS